MNPFDAYIEAKEVLVSRMAAEPYNMTQVAGLLHDQMFLSDDRLAAACRTLYAKRQAYSAYTLSVESGLPIELVQQMCGKYPDTTLPEAFAHFENAFGQYVEFEIGQNIQAWIRTGKTSEEIRIEADKYRRHKGILKGLAAEDGRAEFERDLIKSLRGEVIEYPVKTPLAAMRKFLPQFEPTEYVVVAGRTGMGKSYFALNCLYQCAVDGVPAAYINLENAPKDVQKRLWQMRSGMKFDRDMSRRNDSETRIIHDSWEWVKSCSVKVLNTGNNLQRIANAVRQDYLERGTQLFVIDYLQLMRDGSARRQRLDELAEISATMRGLALDLKIVVMGMAQANREAEKSSNKRPKLSDLRGSGDFEQDATTVMLLYRPSYYELGTDEDGNPYPENYADIHIAKGRNTGPALIKCAFDEVRGFYDPTDNVFPGPSAPLYQPMPRYEPESDTPF